MRAASDVVSERAKARARARAGTFVVGYLVAVRPSSVTALGSFCHGILAFQAPGECGTVNKKRQKAETPLLGAM
jgi:hypothetical protein